ncbi:MAG: DUF4342 domain-containing protein [Clostridiales bacterium]|nr:DUF4342 domain-containing protein [Clostridiales bacterium]
MNNLEKVEKLQEKANITAEEAKKILEECNWDILDAVIKLEAEGRIKDSSGTAYTTESGNEDRAPKSTQEVVESYQQYQKEQKKKEKGIFHSLWAGIKYLFKKGCENKFVVDRKNETIMEIPVVLLIVLLLAFFWAIIILVLVSLFFGFKYSFAGPDLGKDSVNNVMDKASNMAEDLKSDIYEEDAAYAKPSDSEKTDNN